MNSNYCPVQASVDRYCAQIDEDDAMDDAIDTRKSELMQKLDAKDICDAMNEVITDEDLLKDIARAFRCIRSGNHISLSGADDIACGLYNAVERSIEKLAEHQIKQEWGLS